MCHPEIEYTEGEERANLRDHLFGAYINLDCFVGRKKYLSNYSN